MWLQSEGILGRRGIGLPVCLDWVERESATEGSRSSGGNEWGKAGQGGRDGNVLHAKPVCTVNASSTLCSPFPSLHVHGLGPTWGGAVWIVCSLFRFLFLKI